MYYVIIIWGFLTPVPFVITFSTERNQKLPFSDPHPHTLFCDYVIHGSSLRQVIKEMSSGRMWLYLFIKAITHSVMRVGSDTFGDPIFQKGLQN